MQDVEFIIKKIDECLSEVEELLKLNYLLGKEKKELLERRVINLIERNFAPEEHKKRIDALIHHVLIAMVGVDNDQRDYLRELKYLKTGLISLNEELKEYGLPGEGKIEIRKEKECFHYLIDDNRVVTYSKKFNEIIESKPEFSDQIKDVDYLIRCCYRDFDRLKNEFNIINSGFSQGKNIKPQLARMLTESNKKIRAEIPLTIFNYEIAYAFDLFCFNIIRCINFIVDLKSRIKEDYKEEFGVDITKFYNKIKNKTLDDFDKLFIRHYNDWIEDFNKNKRGELTHRRISKQFNSIWKFEIKPLDKESVDEKHEMVVGMPNLSITNLKDFYLKSFENFNKFLSEIIDKLN